MTKKENIVYATAALTKLGMTPGQILRAFKVEKALHRWHELECGVDAGHVERDETTGKPFMVSSRHGTRWPIRDAEMAALKQVEKLSKETGLYFFVQGDPRGVSLYVSKEPFTGNDCTHGVSACSR